MIARVVAVLALGIPLGGCGSMGLRDEGRATAYPTTAWPIVSGFRSDLNPNGSVRPRPHGGVDIRAPRGTAVLAAEDGVVTRVKMGEPVSGNIIYHETSGGWRQLRYAHLDRVLVREGEAVEAGQVIGTVGNTGDWVSKNEAPHLHFAVVGALGRVDPELYLRDPETGLVRCGGEETAEDGGAAMIYPVACLREGVSH